MLAIEESHSASGDIATVSDGSACCLKAHENRQNSVIKFIIRRARRVCGCSGGLTSESQTYNQIGAQQSGDMRFDVRE
jgi:hypothetical protein